MQHLTKNFELRTSTVKLLVKETFNLHQLILQIARESGIIEEGDEPKPMITPYSSDQIMLILKSYYKFDFTKKSRQRKLVDARHIACYILKKYTNLSLDEISYRTGTGDHTSALHGINKIKNLIDREAHIRYDITTLEDEIEQRFKLKAA